MDSSDVEPQLIGSRTNPRSAKPLLHSKFITGITPKGTAPTFYKVEVTAALVMAVVRGNYSEASTTELNALGKVCEGILPVHFRPVILMYVVCTQ
jgi:hypothetical protein